MPRALHALVPILALLTACAPRVDIEAESARVAARSDAIMAAEKAQDLEAAVAFYVADAVVQPSGAPLIRGRDAVRQMYSDIFGSGAIKDFQGTRSTLELAASGDLAVETGINRITLTTPGGDMLDVGKYLAIWKQVDGEWYVSMLSYSSDAAAPVPLTPAK